MRLNKFLYEEGTTTGDVETNTATADNIVMARRKPKKKKKKKKIEEKLEKIIK